ncbi:hypothetical protein [Bordetella sp. 02P26C-1]|uniref:hypothetical protein n=1 Tax=Bordetella sp. 02P26C-1 TaxID=2683195 RepID=UPI001355A41B|nr:hypothetical protein [Bordetella sp. 02P26C-1]MVW78273.1 hypothetical protein [Bordetella sp. 02P26C-1]
MHSHTLNYEYRSTWSDFAVVRNAAGFIGRACAAWWQGIVARRAYEHTLEQLSRYDDHLLRDIGAPPAILRDVQIVREIARSRRARWLSV